MTPDQFQQLLQEVHDMHIDMRFVAVSSVITGVMMIILVIRK